MVGGELDGVNTTAHTYLRMTWEACVGIYVVIYILVSTFSVAYR